MFVSGSPRIDQREPRRADANDDGAGRATTRPTMARAGGLSDRRRQFTAEFGDPAVDLPLLVRFQRADNEYRRAPMLEESVDAVLWFENRLLDERLLSSLPPEGKDQRLNWVAANAPAMRRQTACPICTVAL